MSAVTHVVILHCSADPSSAVQGLGLDIVTAMNKSTGAVLLPHPYALNTTFHSTCSLGSK